MWAALFLIGASAGSELWDVKAGGTPEKGSRVIQGELGFSHLPKLTASYSPASVVALGASIAFDYAYFAPESAFVPGVLFQLPVRISLARTSHWTMGLRFDPGVGAYFNRASFFGIRLSSDLFAVTLGTGINWLYHLPQIGLAFGAGLDMPIAIVVPLTAARTQLWWPILVGPMLEYQVMENFVLTLDTKFGPMLRTNSPTVFAMQGLVGAAYRF